MSQGLNERDICTKFITPAVERAGWDLHTQLREEVRLTDGKVMVRGKLVARGKAKRADYVLYLKPGVPLAVIEAKDASHGVGDGMQQALRYAEMLKVPFAFSSNGSGFLFHDRTGNADKVETTVTLEQFPSPDELWKRYSAWKGLSPATERIVAQDYYTDGSGKAPRYYQTNAINSVIEAVAAGQQRVLLVMATGTGKTYTAFQIIWRLWKSGVKKRILFLADRNILVDQTKTNDFKPFGGAMTKITNRKIDKSFEIYLALYQAITGADEESDIFREFSPDFFDLIVVDECHRGSAAADSAWRRVLEYFSSATQLGLTATPKETSDVSTSYYFGDPVYTYSLKQGIEDGFLAPYKVVRVDIDKDVEGWRPERGKVDKLGNEIEDRIYNQRDFDRKLVLEKRTELVAQTITRFLKATGRYQKTIVFCEDIDHAERMRQALVNENADICATHRKYVMRITDDNEEGKAELDPFINPESTFPVIVTTSKLMTTGVDAQTCRVIVLDQTIQSMTEFKQIIGRGTRIKEDYGKLYFTIIDFKKATELFADPDFDGDPVRIYEPKGNDPIAPPEEEEGTELPPDEIEGDPISTTDPVMPDDAFSTPEGEGGDLARIDRVRSALTTKGRAFVATPFEEIEAPFAVPSRWQWVRWGDLTLSTASGWSPQCENRQRSDGEWGVLKVSAVSWTRFNGEENKALPKGVQPRMDCAAHSGDFLMSRANTAELVGRSVIVSDEPVKLLLSDKLVRCRFSEFTEQHYVNLFNRTIAARSHYVANASGTSDSMKNISRDVILSMPIPLPPLAEQKRIVERVDQLMGLIDELEAKQTRKRDLSTRFTKSSLDALTNAEGPEEFDAAWKRVVENWDVVLDRSEKVERIRRATLSLALAGRLVPQGREQDSAADHLHMLTGVPTTSFAECSGHGWAECEIGTVFEVGTGSTPTKTNTAYWNRGTVAWVTSAATNGDTIEAASEFVTPAAVHDFRLKLFPRGSLVVALYGQGKTRGQVSRLCIDAAVNQACAVIRVPASAAVLQSFVFLFFKNEYDKLRELAAGGAQPNLNLGIVKRTRIRFPPGQEMQRIVAKVEQLMKVCDELEAKLRRAEERAAKLVEAVVLEMVG